MELRNEFTVPLPLSDAWDLLTDVRRIASCMPGATLKEVKGDEYVGTIRIKIGPVDSLFEGKGWFVEKNNAKKLAVLHVEGRDSKGQGFAKGTITATLTADGKKKSKAIIESNIVISGRMASFGRGVVSEISDKLFAQFVACLEKTIK